MSASIETGLAQNEGCVFEKSALSLFLQAYKTHCSSTGVRKRQASITRKHLAGGSSPTRRVFIMLVKRFFIVLHYGANS